MFINYNSNNSINVFAFAGTDGVPLIDAGFRPTADLVKDELKKITDKSVKYIINTHSDRDDTGGNASVAGSATVIAHNECRNNLNVF